MVPKSDPKEVDGWNVAELAGGLLLTAQGFHVQFDTQQVDRFIDILNAGTGGVLRANNGDKVIVSTPSRDHVVLKIEGDKHYPNGIILPVDAFSEVEDNEAPVIEGIRPAFRRVGTKIKRGFRVTSGRRKGRVVSNPATANKPPIKAVTRNKLRAAAKRKKLVRALKAKLTRKKPTSLRLRRLNHTD